MTYLDEKAIKVIEKIISKGGSAEIRKRKNEIVVLEVSGKVACTIPIK